MRSLAAAVFAVFIVLLAACGSSSTGYSKAASTVRPVQAAAQPATAAPIVQAQPATPATNPVERVNGTVQSVDNGKVTLKEGGSFSVTPQTAVTRRQTAAVSALQTGQVVAVTAKRQPDNTLLASLVVVFPPSNGPPLGQRPLDAGNLMTNATVDKVQGNGFTVTFPGGGAQVTMAPDGQVQQIVAGAASDISVGATVSAAVRDGVAQSVSIQ
jgi:hypothetical protein